MNQRVCARPGCEKNVLTTDKRTKFCSSSCAAQVNNVGRFKPKKHCPVCNGPINNRRLKYCSRVCQYSLQNRRSQSELLLKIAQHHPFHLIELPIELLGHETRRQRVFSEQGFACNGCNLTMWRGLPIGLQLEHKDGNRFNHVRENLEGLCGNCHNQTPTWCGRNNRKRVTDEELREAIRQTSSLRKALVAVGMADKGGNYIRVKRIKKEMEEDAVGLEPTMSVFYPN